MMTRSKIRPTSHFLFDKSCLQRIFFIKILFFIIWGCISFQFSYSVYKFISSEDDLNSNTE